jgi:hypothetical protein
MRKIFFPIQLEMYTSTSLIVNDLINLYKDLHLLVGLVNKSSQKDVAEFAIANWSVPKYYILSS